MSPGACGLARGISEVSPFNADLKDASRTPGEEMLAPQRQYAGEAQKLFFGVWAAFVSYFTVRSALVHLLRDTQRRWRCFPGCPPAPRRANLAAVSRSGGGAAPGTGRGGGDEFAGWLRSASSTRISPEWEDPWTSSRRRCPPSAASCWPAPTLTGCAPGTS